MAESPPFYRRTKHTLNPNTQELSLRNQVGAPTVTFSSDTLTGDGPYTLDFGTVTEAVTLDVFGAWDNSEFNAKATEYPRVFLGAYEGDAGAFQFEGTVLSAPPDLFPVVTLPSGLELPDPGWASRITAIADDAGVEKTGKFTLFYKVEIVGGAPSLSVPVAEINLVKTYNP